jgi:hypothetical protein
MMVPGTQDGTRHSGWCSGDVLGAEVAYFGTKVVCEHNEDPLKIHGEGR